MKKFGFLLITIIAFQFSLIAQPEKVDIDGGIQIGFVTGTATEIAPGTIRWTGVDFQGWTGSAW